MEIIIERKNSASKAATSHMRKTLATSKRGRTMRTYMIIENYKHRKTKEIYDRFQEKGRMLPDGVEFIDSWIEENLQKCYQVMKSESIEGIENWMDKWRDLVDFEIIPVLSSSEANDAAQNKSQLDCNQSS